MTEKTLREADALKSEAEELERRLGCWKPTDPCWDGNAAYWGGRLDSVKVQAEGCWCCRARLASDPEPARALAAPPDKEEGADEPERDDLDDLQLCTCGGTRGDHGGPYGEGACPESSCESFTPAAPAATPPKEDRHEPCRYCGGKDGKHDPAQDCPYDGMIETEP
jgi:hypothetical protein